MCLVAFRAAKRARHNLVKGRIFPEIHTLRKNRRCILDGFLDLFIVHGCKRNPNAVDNVAKD